MRAFLSFQPRARGPVVLTCEHATNRLPASTAPARSERAILATHWGYDLGAWDLTREIARRLESTAVGGACSRLLIDVNRTEADPTLIRTEVDGALLSWNRRLGVAEIERRIAGWHAPYHVEVDRRISAHLLRGVRPLIFAVHTFTPELDGKRRDFDVGVLFREHARLGRALARRCRDAGFRTRTNAPYSGLLGMMYSAERHGTQHGLACLELEVNQGVLDTRAAVGRTGAALASALTGLR